MPTVPGKELFYDKSLGLLERWYCRTFGVPIVGLRIRLRWLKKILPGNATMILDAGCGRGVISRMLAMRYPDAVVDAIDQNVGVQQNNTALAQTIGLRNCRFGVQDLTAFCSTGVYDLIVSVDNLEHIRDDVGVLERFFDALQTGGVLVIHVPHYYRRWPIVKWTINFDVPGHVRPGYHQPEIVERVRKSGFVVESTGFSYGFLENLSNNIGYWITGAEERNRFIYAALFPVLNFVAWLGRNCRPKFGAGVWVVARKPA